MFYQGNNAIQNEEALNSEAVRVVGEVEDLYGEVLRLQESWRESFGVDSTPRVSQISRNFFWAALTSPVNTDADIFPSFEESLEEPSARSQDLVLSTGPAGSDDFRFPFSSERIEESPLSSHDPPEQEIVRGNDTPAEPPPEEGASSTDSAATQGIDWVSSLDLAIQRIYDRLVNEDLAGDRACTSNSTSTDVKNEARPESGNAASTPPNSGIPRATVNPRKRRTWKLVKRKVHRKVGLLSEENAARTNKSEFSASPDKISDMDVTNDATNGEVHESARSEQSPIEDSNIDSDTDGSIACMRVNGPESSSAELVGPTPSSEGPHSELRRSNSTPQLHKMQDDSTSPEESLRRGAASRQSMVPWLESNASALVRATNTADAPSRTLPDLTDKRIHVQALFDEYIDSINEEIKVIRELALRSNTYAYQSLTAAMEWLARAKSEIGADVFKPWEEIDFENLTWESNKRSWQRVRGNAIVTGVPKVEFENLLTIVKRIGFCLGRPIDYKYVKDAFRLDKNDPSSPIIVKFTYVALKDALVKASRASELYANQLDNRIKQRSRVSIQDQLTPLNIYLLEKAKVLKDNGCIDLWVDKGNIWVKRRGSLTADQLDCKAKLLVLLREFRFHNKKQ